MTLSIDLTICSVIHRKGSSSSCKRTRDSISRLIGRCQSLGIETYATQLFQDNTLSIDLAGPVENQTGQFVPKDSCYMYHQLSSNCFTVLFRKKSIEICSEKKEKNHYLTRSTSVWQLHINWFPRVSLSCQDLIKRWTLFFPLLAFPLVRTMSWSAESLVIWGGSRYSSDI